MPKDYLKPIPKITPEIEVRFWALVDCGNTDNCWIWAGTYHMGYGYFGFLCKCCKSRNYIMAHRVSYRIYYGVDPADEPFRKYVCHKCDNPKCCNPHHLFLGTRKENNHDRHSKGRTVANPSKIYAYGARNARSKLNESQVRDLRYLYTTIGMSKRRLGLMFGISGETVRGIVNNEWWKHVR